MVCAVKLLYTNGLKFYLALHIMSVTNCALESTDRIKSQYRFKNAKTVTDFNLLYSLFYLNEICSPTTTYIWYGAQARSTSD